MKGKAVLKWLSAMTAATMICSPLSVLASGIEEAGNIVDGSQLTLSDFVEDEVLILTRGNHLARGSSSITNLGGRVVGVGGETTCFKDCDTVICNLYLEQKNSAGNWYTYDYWDYSTTNDHGLQVSTTKKVAADHWYRVRGSHIAILNNAIESAVTLTDGIWID